jgi:prophage regulatory protein
MVINFLRLPAYKKKLGKSKSAIYLEIQEGLLPKPVPIGARAVAFPEHEADAINAARMAGMDDEKIRKLVIELEAKRKTFIDKVGV